MWNWAVQHDSLRWRLLLAIIGGVAAISAVAMVLDHSRAYRLGLDRIVVSLDEQAGALREAHRVIAEPNQFVRYVHRFCAAMDQRVSPGHHIMVLDADGGVLVRSGSYRHPPLEQAMFRMSGPRALIMLDGHAVACVRRSSPEGYTYLLAQYLDHEQAAMLTGVLKVALHWRLTEHADLSEAMERVNHDLLTCTAEEHFATACVGVWEAGKGRWTYCAAGHPGGVLLREGTALELPSTGPLLGVLPGGEWFVESLTLTPRDRVFLYTDGIVEVEVGGRPFGFAGLASLLGRTACQSLHEQSRTVIQTVTPTNGDRRRDDMTILAFQFEPETNAGRG